MLSPCYLCTALCCSTHIITVTSFDVLEISQKAKMKPELFAEIIPLRLLFFDNKTVLECYEGGYMYEYILALKSNPCVFLQDNRCSIHDIAPMVCKVYPYTVNEKMHPRALCPLMPKAIYWLKGSDIDVNKLKERLNAYKDIVHKWNLKKGKKQDCLNFLLEVSKKHSYFQHME